MLTKNQNNEAVDAISRARKEMDHLERQRAHASDLGNQVDAVYFAREIDRHVEYIVGLQSMFNIIDEAK